MRIRVAHQLTMLVSIALLLGAVSNVVSPRGIAWYEAWSRKIEQQAIDAGLTLVTVLEAERIISEGECLVFDARSHDEFIEGHLPGAISVPYRDVASAFEQVQVLISPDQPILVYCSGMSCDDSIGLGRFLKEQQVATVAVFLGGYDQWQNESRPVEIGE